ncbi:MAG: arylsulfotransferase family protein, partial [Pseudomonadota bacterium]
LDRCGNLVWRTDRPAHHAVALTEDGAVWAPSADNYYDSDQSPYGFIQPPFAIDTAIKVTPDGRVVEDFSIADSLIDSGKFGLLTLTGESEPGLFPGVRLDFEEELFHLNDVEPLPRAIADDFPLFEAGDLLLSLRNRNLVLVVDGVTKQVKWWRIGPWVRQHDPDWRAGGTIVVFDNFRDASDDGSVFGGTRIIEIDPMQEGYAVLYGEKPEQQFYSRRRGKQDVRANGGILVTDAENGRLFEFDENGRITWEYVNRYDEDRVARITDGRVYEPEYFEADFDCSQTEN